MNKHYLKTLASSLLLAGLSPALLAANAITAIDLVNNSQNEPVLAISFAAAPTTPASFSIINPPRIAFDFKDTRNQTGKNLLPFNSELLNAATIVESSDRTRLVLNLNKSSAHSTRIDGKQLLVSFNAADKPLAADSSPLASPAAANLGMARQVANVDFRRGSKGEARIIVDLPTSNSPVDIKREGNNLIVDLAGIKLPRHLERRLDVTDFATPSSRVDAVNQNSGSRIAIQSGGNWEYSSYQTERQLVVEIRAVSQEEAEANLLAQGKTNYKGQRLSLNFQTVDVRSLLQVIAEFTGLNIITSDSVTGSLSLRLNDVPWDQALDLILTQKNLEKRQVGNVIRIAPRSELVSIERQIAEANRIKKTSEPFITETFTIRYRAAEEIKEAIKDLGRFSQVAETERESNNNETSANSRSATTVNNALTLMADSRSNRLIARAGVSMIEEVRKVIEILDVPLRQVLIEARIVEAKDNFQRDLGVRLGVTKVGGDTAIGNWNGEEGSGMPIPGTGSVLGAPSVWNPNIDLPAGLAGASIGAIFKNASTLIGLELSAMQAEDKGKVVSSPRILTADRTKATITEGTEIPYQSIDDNGKSTTTFKKANLSLSVTPQVTPEDDIIMELNITKDTPNTKLSLDAGPAIDNKTVDTQVRVENGGTVVIGGIYVQEENNVENKVPLLADIPLLGVLFRNKSVTNNRRELLIFITPRIVENELIAR
ncbi:type IV pilus assembly protein PilQ [Vogesella indigofera]|uniref:Type IV pilus biogenesis and competence protein PilQ n=1 Tax=Vogesella indigofera TaxID=45465 RepID=A0A495BKK6_VOGIN|nr:type IV pilus secretin PilQ [Vogesella indigofera]RKQ62192.1 type IV pilus assembly protein PilQ [Vogesella indigofera]